MHIKSPTTANPKGYIYTIRAQESAFLPISLIETCFKALSKSIKIKSRRKKRSRIRGAFNIDKPVSGKSVGVRMGKGKGSVSYWVCSIQSGQILYEMDGIPLQLAKTGSQLAYQKLPLKTEFVFLK